MRTIRRWIGEMRACGYVRLSSEGGQRCSFYVTPGWREMLEALLVHKATGRWYWACRQRVWCSSTTCTSISTRELGPSQHRPAKLLPADGSTRANKLPAPPQSTQIFPALSIPDLMHLGTWAAMDRTPVVFEHRRATLRTHNSEADWSAWQVGELS